MQTYTHFLIALAASRPLIAKWNNNNNNNSNNIHIPPPRPSAFWLGSILPDLPLILLTIGCFIIDLISNNDTSYVQQLFDDWYFDSKWVMSAHNLFHAPISLFVMLLVAYVLWKKQQQQQKRVGTHTVQVPAQEQQEQAMVSPFATFLAWLFWVLINATVHAISDIPVHHDDGPLLLFPFNFTTRYYSPVSYWDRNYYGLPFSICEHTLDLFLIIRECRMCYQRRRQQQQDGEQQHQSSEELIIGNDNIATTDMEQANNNSINSTIIIQQDKENKQDVVVVDYGGTTTKDD